MSFDINRVAHDIYQLRMRKGETWGTAEGDYNYAKQLVDKWEKELESKQWERSRKK